MCLFISLYIYLFISLCVHLCIYVFMENHKCVFMFLCFCANQFQTTILLHNDYFYHQMNQMNQILFVSYNSLYVSKFFSEINQ